METIGIMNTIIILDSANSVTLYTYVSIFQQKIISYLYINN